MIREMRYSDGLQVLRIYAFGLETGNATFETTVPRWDDWWLGHLRHSRLVCELDGDVVGWVALSPVSARRAYSGVAEISLYVAGPCLGQGIGSRLMQAVIASSEAHGIWTLYASLFPENTASVGLLEKFGFRRVGIREQIASVKGVWRDTLIMERRSRVVGAQTS
jgi:L-amino acid N-acyltransferase YncA